jgi:hypothetical protein
MVQNVLTEQEAVEAVPISAVVPRQLRLDLQELARRHDRSLSAELRRALGLYVRAAEKRP